MFLSLPTFPFHSSNQWKKYPRRGLTKNKQIILPKCLNSVFKVIFSDITIVNVLQTFESAVQENVSINGQAWQEASDDCFRGK